MTLDSPHCYLGFGTVRKCPNMCKGTCGYAPREDRAWSEFLDVLTGQGSNCPTLDELQMESEMTEAERLFALYDNWSDSRRALAYAGFLKLAAAYPQKNMRNGGTADLWLTAIAEVRAMRQRYQAKEPPAQLQARRARAKAKRRALIGATLDILRAEGYRL